MTLENDDYYNPHDLLTRNGVFNFVVAGRGRGKTYAFKTLGLKNWIKRREQFIYLRRWDTELKDKGTFWDDMRDAFPDYDLRINGNLGEARQHCDDGEQCKTHKWTTVCYFQALSKAGNVKSVPFPHVTMIIFDEIFANNRRYLPAETEAFQEYYSTVDRWKDKTRVFFLSNSVELANPYFLAYDIMPNGKEFQKFHGGYITLENVGGGEFALKVRQTRFGQFIRNQEYAKYAIDNQFRDNTDNLVTRLPHEHLAYTFTLDTGMARLAFHSYLNDSALLCYHVTRRLPKQQTIYVTQARDVTPETPLLGKRDALIQTILKLYKTGRITFDAAQTRSAFFAYLKDIL